MKIFVKTLKGTHFEIDVKPEDTVADVKKNIETSQGQSVYPAEQQMLIHQGKILKDPTTLAESDVAENSFVVVMLSKAKAPAGSQGGGSSAAAAPPSQPVSAPTAASTTTTPITNPTPTSTPTPTPASTQAPAPVPAPAPASPPSTTVPLVPAAAESTPVDSAAPAPVTSTQMETDPYSQAASNLVAGSKMDEAVRHILDIGGGTWDRETVVRALRAAFNNPERAIEYLYSGIPEQAEAPRPAAPPTQAPTAQAGDPTPQPGNPTPQAQPAIPSGGPNANPLDLFPQGLPTVGGNSPGNNLDFLRNSPQFRALQSMVQANPHILQPMLQELAKQNPQLMRLIQEHQADFVRLINEPPEGGGEGNPLNQIPSNVPQAIQVTPEEREAIERLEALGFDRALVLEVFFACNKNEELAANYLLDHMNEFDD